MKKILFLLLVTISSYGQTLQNPTFGNTTTNTLKIKTPATVTSVNFLSTVEVDGSVAKVLPKTSILTNDSSVSGTTATDALNTLNTSKIGGTGTINYVPLFTGSTALGNSIMYQNVNGLRIGSQKTVYAQAIGVSKLITSLDKHIFDDYSILSPTVGGDGFGVFDVSTEMLGSVNNNHFMAYQSRMLYNASGNLTDVYGFTGFFVYNNHLGSGTITNAQGVLIKDVAGTGPITNNYGIKIDPIARGTNNYAIYSDGGDSRFKGNLYNFNSKGFYSYGVGASENDPNRKAMSFVSDSYGSSFYTFSAGTQQPADFFFKSKYDPSDPPKDLMYIKASNGNIGIGTSAPTTYGTFKTLSINGTTGALIEFKTNDVFKAYISNDNTSFDLYNGGNTAMNFLTNSSLRGSFSNTGVFRVTNLSGTGTRQVVVDASGNFSATTAFTQPLRYKALMYQAGSSAPTVTVLENNIGSIIWTRSSTGVYIGTLSGAFTSSKTAVLYGNSVADTQITGYSNSINTVSITTYSAASNTPKDGALVSATILIEVYP